MLGLGVILEPLGRWIRETHGQPFIDRSKERCSRTRKGGNFEYFEEPIRNVIYICVESRL